MATQRLERRLTAILAADVVGYSRLTSSVTGKQQQERKAMLLRKLLVPEDCCAVSKVLERVGDKWSVLVVVTLGRGPKRFGELRRRIADISQRMLTLTLRGLERDGLVTRTVFSRYRHASTMNLPSWAVPFWSRSQHSN